MASKLVEQYVEHVMDEGTAIIKGDSSAIREIIDSSPAEDFEAFDTMFSKSMIAILMLSIGAEGLAQQAFVQGALWARYKAEHERPEMINLDGIKGL